MVVNVKCQCQVVTIVSGYSWGTTILHGGVNRIAEEDFVLKRVLPSTSCKEA